MKTSKGGKRRTTPKSGRIRIIDDQGNVQPPGDFPIDDGGTVTFTNERGIDATIHFSGDKALFHHGKQVDQQPVAHKNSETLTGKGKKKSVRYEVEMAGQGPSRPGNGTIKVGQTARDKRGSSVGKTKKRARRK